MLEIPQLIPSLTIPVIAPNLYAIMETIQIRINENSHDPQTEFVVTNSAGGVGSGLICISDPVGDASGIISGAYSLSSVSVISTSPKILISIEIELAKELFAWTLILLGS